jgi:hypothetical protein
MPSIVPNTSRRHFLGAIVIAPAMVTAKSNVISTWQAGLDVLHNRHGDEPVKLVRSKEGRELSLARYQTAHDFFPDVRKTVQDLPDFLYHAGITAQLGLSAHLLDVGFPDEWCARNIGLRVAKSLAYANATGFGHDCPKMARLTRVLTPYWKWNPSRLRDRRPPSAWGFTPDEVKALLAAMLKQVRHVTGHTPDRLMQMREGPDA